MKSKKKPANWPNDIYEVFKQVGIRQVAYVPDAGHTQLIEWLQRQAPEPVHACLESTGTYGEDVATALVDAGHRVSIVNPAAVKARAF